MGRRDVIAGADFSSVAIGFSPPVADGVQYWNYFGETAERAARNLVLGKPAPSVVGVPVNQSGYATFTSANHINTNVLDAAPAVTLLCAARFPALPTNTFGYMVGNYGGGGFTQGSNLYIDSPTRRPYGLSVRDNVGVVVQNLINFVPTDIATWSFYALRIGAGGSKINDLTRGLLASSATGFPKAAPTAQPFRVGHGGPGVGTSGPSDIAFAAIYHRELSDAEVDKVLASVRSHLATKSITI